MNYLIDAINTMIYTDKVKFNNIIVTELKNIARVVNSSF